MVTTTDYNNYFGANTAPSNFTRLEYLAVKVIKGLITSDIPVESDTIYVDFKNAIIEQINYFSVNQDILDDIINIGSSFTIGKFSESGSQTKISPNDNLKRVSPNTYAILLDINLLYTGLGC